MTLEELVKKWESGKPTTDIEKAILAVRHLENNIAEDALKEYCTLRKIEMTAYLMHYETKGIADARLEYEKAVAINEHIQPDVCQTCNGVGIVFGKIGDCICPECKGKAVGK